MVQKKKYLINISLFNKKSDSTKYILKFDIPIIQDAWNGERENKLIFLSVYNWIVRILIIGIYRAIE